jgi:hypothetical protein
MSKTLGAIKLRIAEIVLKENRPFCIADLEEFEIGGKKHRITYDTAKNIVSFLKKTGFVERAFSSRPAFYTRRGKKFDKKMTLNHTGVSVINSIIPERLIKETPIYSWLKNCPTKKQALHNIRLTFKAPSIWNTFSNNHVHNINAANKDIQLLTVTFFDYIDVIVTIHHSDTVSVAISCSFRPIAIDAMDIFRLFEALTRTETSLANTIEKNLHRSSSTAAVPQIPPYRAWIVKMWHFGIDTRTTYGKKEFEVTFEEGMVDLYRIYTKRIEDGKNIVRAEHQENPNQPVIDAIVRKLYPDGHLVVPVDKAAD